MLDKNQKTDTNSEFVPPGMGGTDYLAKQDSAALYPLSEAEFSHRCANRTAQQYSNSGHLPYCPSPSDSDENVYCCQFFTFGGDTFPSCCRFPIYTGLVYALVISAVLLFLLMLFLYCWFWPSSLLNVRRRNPQRRPNGFSKVNDSSL
ncbi:hypothetical protein ANCCAN_14372 [Ancylostoma caninum]|uniref:Uncharacterized protein n=1 Tax=Ancylostoma caninum TaxID=29170 RepID=A0A368G5S9_ANCCA|nr:hypothetical protein ANCCAN_14372 [Ancylostoma caninum]